MSTKMTILYERLSREDERENESVSIENQKAYLEEYANRNGFANFIHLTDDGWSGTRWDRPAFLQMMDEVERGNVGRILIKDMSRLGREYRRKGEPWSAQRRPYKMVNTHHYSNPQKRGIHGLESPQQNRNRQLQIQETESHT